MTSIVLHKISDATGHTLDIVSRACMAQFADVNVTEKRWTMVHSHDLVAKVLEGIKKAPGFVIFTVVDDELSEQLILGCKKLKVPCIDLLNPVLSQMGNYLGLVRDSRPGSQHVMDGDYYAKIDALHYVLAHDEGQSLGDIDDADIVLVGVSRTTKTPTSIFLANRGFKTANVPYVPGMELPQEVLTAKRPLIIGVTKDPQRLVHIRLQRIELQGLLEETDYTDIEAVTAEIIEAREVCERQEWPILDVTKKSVEETADTIIQMLNTRLDGVV
ncbi:MAG: kinase/pyrophosphorylase [Magnetovibrio sp.]|nr:kinase/pyrophosphorylase [Magnetovibrio sp.]